MVLAGCAELSAELFDEANIGYCYGCDWIVQEWHDEWSTHNSKPYDDEAACEQALATAAQRDRELGLRCINEEELIDARRNPPSQSEKDRLNLNSCWGCDWMIEELRYGTWARRDMTTYKTQGLCEQSLWYALSDEPDGRYRCVY